MITSRGRAAIGERVKGLHLEVHTHAAAARAFAAFLRGVDRCLIGRVARAHAQFLGHAVGEALGKLAANRSIARGTGSTSGRACVNVGHAIGRHL